MTEKYFVDTNIFVYCRDKTDAIKRDKALKLVKNLWENQTGVISFQVIIELCAVMSKKFSIADDDIEREVNRLLTWEPIPLGSEIIEQAFELRRQYKLSYFDSWIVSAALLSDCKAIYTEDLASGATYHSVKVINPFLNK